MIKYSRYLLSNIFHKKAIYVIPFVLFVIFNLLLFIQIMFANNQGLAFINSLSTFDKFYPFIFMGIFSSLIVVYAFKDTELDGSDLLILSKPISRRKMILSKFLVTYFMLVVYAVVTGIDFTLMSLMDSVALKNDQLASIRFGFSLSIGALIVSFVVVSIIIIISTFFGRMGILNFSAALIPVIPIFSFIIAPISGGIPTQSDFIRNPSYKMPANQISFGAIPQDQEDVLNFLNTNNNQTYYFLNDKKSQQDFQKYKNDSWYNRFAYFDIWYHWGRFFSLFVKQDRVLRTNIKNFKSEKIKIESNKHEQLIKIGNKEYHLFIYPGEVTRISEIFEFSPEEIQVFSDDFAWLKEYLSSNHSFSVVEVSSALESIFNKDNNLKPSKFKDAMEKGEIWQNISKEKPNSLGILLYHFFTSGQKSDDSNDPLAKMFADFNLRKANKLVNDNASLEIKNEIKNFLVENGSTIEVAKPYDFISTQVIIIIWGSITLLMVSISFLAYFKRDFK